MRPTTPQSAITPRRSQQSAALSGYAAQVGMSHANPVLRVLPSRVSLRIITRRKVFEQARMRWLPAEALTR
jgi:hypothetical protein